MSNNQVTTQRQTSDVLTSFAPRTTIRTKILRMFLLLTTFCILLLGGISYYVTVTYWDELQVQNNAFFGDPNSVGYTILIISALLIALSFLLGTLVATQLTKSIDELAGKIKYLRPGHWDFPFTVHSGDEIEGLDGTIAQLVSRLHGFYDRLEGVITDRNTRLEEEYAIDRAIVDSIEYGVIATDLQGTITLHNPAAQKLIGEEESMLGKHASDILHLQNLHGPIDATMHPLQGALHCLRPYRAHPAERLALLQRGGAALPITMIAAPLLRNRECFGSIIVFGDASVERHLDYLKSEFVTLASHQLRTPLSSLRWYVEMLKDNNVLSQEQRDHVMEIDTATLRISRIVESLLHIAKLEDHSFKPQETPLNLATYLRERCADWSDDVKKVDKKLEARIPSTTADVQTDIVLLEMVLENFWTNALKYSRDHDTIIVEVVQNDASTTISVHDEGIGISAQDRKRIGEKFFRAKNALSVNVDGTGLGLYMCKLIAKTLGADFSLESEEGKGTTASITLHAHDNAVQG